jgi:2-keto-3-deoxy-L-rhamnonate aldolase RhmA
MLKAGKVAYGAGVGIGHPDSAEVMAGAGYDFLLLDTEHSPMDVSQVQTLLQAMSFSRTVPLVRVAWNDMVMIKKALDIGAYGIIVPWVNTKEDAIRAVQAIRYPPEGLRGFGPRRAALRDPDYVKTANDEIFLGVQIETQAALDNLDEILSVEGIDATLIGPSDLSLSLGIYQQWENPRFKSAIDRILEASQRHGVAPGSLAPFEWQLRLEQGFKMIMLTQDLMLLQAAAAAGLNEGRAFSKNLGLK